MNISKSHLELLLTNYIASGIITDNTEHSQYTWSELVVNLLEYQGVYSINVHFNHHTETDATIQRVYNDIIEFSLTARDEQTNEYLSQIELRTYVNKNVLYGAIDILKNLCCTASSKPRPWVQ